MNKMNYGLLILCSTLVVYPLAADDEPSTESSETISWLIKLEVPASWYTDSWDPTEKLPLKINGVLVEEKDLIVDLDEAIRKSIERNDRLRQERQDQLNGFKTNP